MIRTRGPGARGHLMDNALKLLDLNQPYRRAARWFALFAVAASLSFFASPRASAQDSGAQQQAQPQDDQNAPSPQQDQRRVKSRDNISQNNQNAQGAPDQDQGQNPQNPNDDGQRSNRRHNRHPAAADAPGNITIPAGKVIFIRLNQPLSSDHSHPGEGFTATLDQPIVVNGGVGARRGETAVGTVTSAKKAGRAKRVSQRGPELAELRVVAGHQLPL